MKLRELRFLADENVSPKVVAFLRAQHLDVLDVKVRGWQDHADSDLLVTAHRENRWVLTHDADFGALVSGRVTRSTASSTSVSKTPRPLTSSLTSSSYF